MKKLLYTILAVTGLIAFGSCSKEDPFGLGDNAGKGFLSRDAISVSMSNEEVIVRSTVIPTKEDFMIEIIPEGATEAVESYKFGEMPEIVPLAPGKYSVRASYGENPAAAFDAPFYAGNSEFDIVEGEINSTIDPVVCKLANVRVSIKFDSVLSAVMSDAKVTVETGDNASLEFTKEDEDQARSGYFAFVPNVTAGTTSTIAATFSGMVEGYETVETKTYDNVQPGNHYLITFRLHQPGVDDPGDVSGSIKVDATIEKVDGSGNVDVDDDILADDMRPGQGGQGGQGGNDPEPPTPQGGPTVTASAGIQLDAVNYASALKEVKVHISSQTGITDFKVEISSTSPDFISTLKDLLDTEIDLCNPGPMEENLARLGLIPSDGLDANGNPANIQKVRGLKEMDFDITQFMGILTIFTGRHTFKLIVTDAGGTTEKSLIIEI